MRWDKGKGESLPQSLEIYKPRFPLASLGWKGMISGALITASPSTGHLHGKSGPQTSAKWEPLMRLVGQAWRLNAEGRPSFQEDPTSHLALRLFLEFFLHNHPFPPRPNPIGQ